MNKIANVHLPVFGAFKHNFIAFGFLKVKFLNNLVIFIWENIACLWFHKFKLP